MGARQEVRVGIVGGGLMGKEIAAAIARWPALVDHPVRPVLTAVCDVNPDALSWFDRIDTVTTKVTDYRDLLADDDVDVVYIAVRHDLHEQLYVDTIRAGKDLLAEKPFGIDLAAAERIVAAADASPGVFVRCSSEIPFFPGAQAAIRMIRDGELGELIEATNAFCHSSDLDQGKPINWKRQRQYCGDAGVMNDLGMHVLHAPLRLGWTPAMVYAVLQDLVPFRVGPDGTKVVCDTYENATLVCTVNGADRAFPLSLLTKRIDPGQKNTWSLRATGMGGGVEFSTRYPKTLRVMRIDRGEQVWQEVEMGSQSVYPTVTGGIFETGFSDAILQMWAAFLAERAGELGDRFGCVTPQEALTSHRVWAAAMRSADTAAGVRL
ncbi:Gfo/Idh/MocA family protein [Jiangella muralis]|uniref:Gfo/Idh/MocA family protein n=1 Tax=Jiangella muralis TaxID=702383 RepID=UPI00069CDB80|nr:Gfo/Idh/MocA family oxidoreductase [Jiangella muralis]